MIEDVNSSSPTAMQMWERNLPTRCWLCQTVGDKSAESSAAEQSPPAPPPGSGHKNPTEPFSPGHHRRTLHNSAFSICEFCSQAFRDQIVRAKKLHNIAFTIREGR